MAKYLNKENRDQIAKCRVGEYPLPFDAETLVRVKSQSIKRMNRYSEAVNAGGERGRKDTYALVAESIIDEQDEQIWTVSEVAELAGSDCRLVTSLIKMIGRQNGADDADIEQMVGNLNETE